MLLRFADCELDPAQRTLRRRGDLVDVDPKAFDLLVLLAERDGALLSRDEMLRALWPDAIVSDAAVSQCVRRARVAIGDADRGARRIETVHRHGLRLAAGVSVVQPAPVVAGRRGHLALVGGREVLAPVATPAAAPSRGAALVGRSTELARLEAAFDAALAPQARIVLVVGEPGIGKTRLVDEMLARCAARGATVAWGRCHEDADVPAYWPWAQAMRALLDAAEPGAIDARTAQPLARVIPALRERLGVAESPLSSDPYALFEQWTRLLAGFTRRAPLVIALDDLQWADAATLQLLRFLARERPALPLLVVGTWRDAESRSANGPAMQPAELAGGRDVIQLGALSATELALLAGARADDTSVARLHRLTGGNPYFAVELLAELRGAALTAIDAAGLPQSVRGFVADRIARLGEPVQRLLAAAAVLGEEPSPRLLRRLASADAGSAATLRAAVDAGLLLPSGADGLRFAHALVREVLYDALPDLDRADLHARAAGAIEAEHRRDPVSQAETLARHYASAVEATARAGELPDARLVRGATRYAERAAQRAADVGSWEESARHAGRALALQGGARNGASRAALTTALGEAQMQGGMLEDGRATLRDAAQLARARRSWPELARIAFARVGRFGRSLRAEDPEALALLDEVIAALPPRPGPAHAPLVARVLARRALVYKPALDETIKRELLDRAESLARSAGDGAVLAYALWARHVASWDPRELAARTAVSKELLALGVGARDLEIEALARICGIRDAIDGGDLAALGAAVAKYQAMIDQLRHPVVRFYLTPRRVMQALVEGRIRAAEQLILAGLQAPDVHDVRAQLVDPLPGQFIFLRREQGRLVEMEGALDAFAQGNDRLPFVIALQGVVQAESGRLGAARAHLDDVAAYDFRDIAFDHNRLMVFSLGAELCAAVGDATRAAQLEALLTPFAGRHVVVADGLAYLDTVERPLGLLAAARGDRAAAVVHLEAAARTLGAIGARARLAHTEVDLAAVVDSRERASQLLASAADTARELDLTGLGATIERLRAARA